MDLKTLGKSMIPLIIGILIGAGFTKNKAVMGIIIGYVIFMILFSLFKDKITKVKKATDKKTATVNEVIGSVNKSVEVIEKGNILGKNWFEKIYPNYAFYFCVAMFLSVLLLLYFKQWLWSSMMFIGLNFFIAQNQLIRMVRHTLDNLRGEYKDGNK